METISPIQEVLNRERNRKMRSFQIGVVKPITDYLKHELQNEGKVMISGSYANGNKLRHGSDFDLIVLNETLKDPNKYLDFLSVFYLNMREYIELTGVVPLSFTEVAREEEVSYIGSEYFEHQNSVHREEIGGNKEAFLRFHFLFYPGEKIFYQREPRYLADTLISKGISILGEKPERQTFPPMDDKEKNLDYARWTTERALAELIFNKGILPDEYLLSKFKNMILTTIRGPFGDTVLGSESDGNVYHILKKTDGNGVLEVINPLQEIHTNGVDRNYALEELITPAVCLLDLIDVYSKQLCV